LGFFELSSKINWQAETNGWLQRVLLPKPKQPIDRASEAPFQVLPAASRIAAEPVHAIAHVVCSIFGGLPPSRIGFSAPSLAKYLFSMEATRAHATVRPHIMHAATPVVRHRNAHPQAVFPCAIGPALMSAVRSSSARRPRPVQLDTTTASSRSRS
jgi:hypothetical protein